MQNEPDNQQPPHLEHKTDFREVLDKKVVRPAKDFLPGRTVAMGYSTVL
jgi:hypothetical protein